MGNKSFHSPTHGKVSLAEVRKYVLAFMEKDPEVKYQIVIGTDSAPKNRGESDFITALVIHKVGSGAIYFWRRFIEKKQLALRERIYEEATLSLMAADEILNVFSKDGITRFDVEIHVDVGKAGKTREMINEVVGLIRGSGFACKVKPESFGATTVADRHT